MPLLTAEWRDLLMITYTVDPSVLEPLLPPGVEVDPFDGQALVSVVGFRFLDTRVRGMALPGLSRFEEVNLRTYVRGRTPDGWHGGVCFVREIVPSRVVAFGARRLYGEPYVACPMRHRVQHGGQDHPTHLEYWWYPHERLNHMRATTAGSAEVPRTGTMEAFLTQRYWGYGRTRGGGTRCYRVHHPDWRVQAVTEVVLDVDAAHFWGQAFVEPLAAAPVCALYAEGSEIAIDSPLRVAA